MYLWDIIVIRRATNALLQERIVVSLLQWMSFYEDAPFYSSASEDLIHGKSEENNPPLIDLVTPRVYPGLVNETDTKLYSAEEQREIDKFKESL